MNDNKNTSEIFNLSLLKEALECGILDTDSVLDTLMSTKREQVRKIHNYAITPPAKEGGRWQTCYKGSDGKRKNIKAQTEDELLDKLIDVYKRQLMQFYAQAETDMQMDLINGYASGKLEAREKGVRNAL